MALLEDDPVDAALDEDGDVLIDEDGMHLISGLDGIAQLCRIAMMLFKEEWFLDLDKGMPWYQEILGEKFDSELEALMRRRASETLLKVPGVIGIASLAITFEDNELAITWSVQTKFGDTEPDTLDLSGGS